VTGKLHCVHATHCLALSSTHPLSQLRACTHARNHDESIDAEWRLIYYVLTVPQYFARSLRPALAQGGSARARSECGAKFARSHRLAVAPVCWDTGGNLRSEGGNGNGLELHSVEFVALTQ
jgi:hypothetical protein